MVAEPLPAAGDEGDDTLFLLFCCCHPDLAPASQVALTLRAVGGLTTREIAQAFFVPEAAFDLPDAASAYAEASRLATNVTERNHLIRQAARAGRRSMEEHSHP